MIKIKKKTIIGIILLLIILFSLFCYNKLNAQENSNIDNIIHNDNKSSTTYEIETSGENDGNSGVKGIPGTDSNIEK